MFRIVLVLLLIYLVWLLLFLLYERKRRKKGAPQKEPCQTVREAEIIGKSRFKISHSMPQVRSYPKGEAEAKKASTFALENGQEPSEEPDEQPDIDEIPLTYGSSDAPSFEEEDEELPIRGESEYATEIDFERVLEALAVIHRHAHTDAERQRTGDTLRALEGTHLMETLRSDAKRSGTIDEIVMPVSRIFTAAKRRNIPSEWFCPNSMNPLCSKSNERKRVRLTLRESPLTSESNNSIHPSGGPIQSSRHKTKIYDQKTFSYRSRPAAIHFLCLCPRQRLVGHQPSHQHGDELFRPSHETHLRHRCGRGTHRWGKSVLKICAT